MEDLIRGGRAYTYPGGQSTTNPTPAAGDAPPPARMPPPRPSSPARGSERSEYDNVPDRPLPSDPGYRHTPNPDGSEAGPLYLSPEAERWVDENVIGPGYVVDWGTREIIDPETGEVKGIMPTSFPRMM